MSGLYIRILHNRQNIMSNEKNTSSAYETTVCRPICIADLHGNIGNIYSPYMPSKFGLYTKI